MAIATPGSSVREDIAERLLRAAARGSYNPDTDIGLIKGPTRRIWVRARLLAG